MNQEFDPPPQSWLSKRCRDWYRNWEEAADARRALVLALFCSVVFISVNWRNYGNDGVPLTLVPVELWRHGTLNVDDYRGYYDSLELEQRWPFTESHGHLYPRKSIFVSLVAAPFYLPPVLAGVPTENVEFWIAWGRLAAAALTGLCIAWSYLVARRWADVPTATGFTLLLAFGTCLWTTVGQMLFDHIAVTFVAGMALQLYEFPLSPRRAFLAALCAGASVALRPTTVVLLAPVGLYLAWPGRLGGVRAWAGALAGIVAFPLALAVSNRVLFDDWLQTGYPKEVAVDLWTPIAQWPEGLAGLLIAPNSGLFTQSPFTLLAVVGGWVVWMRPGTRDAGLLRTYTICFVSYWLLFARWHDWQGGFSFGTRMLCEGYPLWLPLVLVGWEQLRSRCWAMKLLVAASAWCLLYQLANIATFDALTRIGKEPLHEPWEPQKHFFAWYIREFGLAKACGAVAVTLLEFVVVVLVGMWALCPLLTPDKIAIEARK